MRKSDMLTILGDVEFTIGRSESGQLVVKLTPQEWEALPEVLQETIIQIDILLAKEWALHRTWTKKEGEWLLCSRL
jgi:hypothetical protein